MNRTGELELEAPAVPTVYRLTKNVKNPKPDRRNKDASVTMMVEWKEDSLWLYIPAKEATVAHLRLRGKYDQINSHDDGGQFGLLLPHLEPVEIVEGGKMTDATRDSLRAFELLHNVQDYVWVTVIKYLFYEGRITLAEIETILGEINVMDEAAYNQFMQ